MTVPSSEHAPRNGSPELADPALSPDPSASPQAGPARSAARAGAEPRHPAEHTRLETLLAERARDALQQRREVGRIKALLRDASVDFERVLATAEPYEKVELARQRDAAVARALEAEAGRVEALFRLDELMGHLADASFADAPGLAAAAEPEGERARLTRSAAELETALRASRADCERMQQRQAAIERELNALREHAQTLERELESAGDRQQHAEGMADALRDTRRSLSELARAVQRAARSASHRDAPAQAADDAAPAAGVSRID